MQYVAVPLAFSTGAGHDAVVLADAQAGVSYDMAVRYRSGTGRGDVDATVTVTVRGETVYTRQATMTPGQTWAFGSVNPTDANVAPTWDSNVDTFHALGF